MSQIILHAHQRTPQNVYKIVINGCDTVPRWSFAVRLGSKQFCRNLYQEIIIAMYFINNGNAVKMLHKIYEQQQQIQHNMFINEFWCYFFFQFHTHYECTFFIFSFHFCFCFQSIYNTFVHWMGALEAYICTTEQLQKKEKKIIAQILWKKSKC